VGEGEKQGGGDGSEMVREAAAVALESPPLGGNEGRKLGLLSSRREEGFASSKYRLPILYKFLTAGGRMIIPFRKGG